MCAQFQQLNKYLGDIDNVLSDVANKMRLEIMKAKDKVSAYTYLSFLRPHFLLLF